MSDMVKTREAAKAVGLSPYFLYRQARGNPAAYRAGRALRWDLEALKAWMRQQAVQQAEKQ